MEEFEYLKESPTIENGRILDGYKAETQSYKTIFGGLKTKEEFVEHLISETEYLNRKGKEGWELVTIITNSFDHDIKEYYFIRKIKQKTYVQDILKH